MPRQVVRGLRAAPAKKNRKVRTPADEDLPPWVPVSGRLTVVESSDIAENLGLVPMGSAKTSDPPIAPTGATSWTYIAGETFVSHR